MIPSYDDIKLKEVREAADYINMFIIVKPSWKVKNGFDYILYRRHPVKGQKGIKVAARSNITAMEALINKLIKDKCKSLPQ
jgi:hypothetical protein